MGERARARIQVRGRVQGVAYRAYAVDEARRLGLKGWVKNLSDGSVEAVAEGERGDVDAFVRWCRRGPPAASVEEVEVAWGPARGDLSIFRIEH